MKKIDYKIVNITSSGEVGFNINLNLLALELKNSEYEPEKFSGLIFRLVNPASTLQIFKSGKFIVTGCKDDKDIEESIEQLTKIIGKFKDDYQQKRKEKEKSS